MINLIEIYKNPVNLSHLVFLVKFSVLVQIQSFHGHKREKETLIQVKYSFCYVEILISKYVVNKICNFTEINHQKKVMSELIHSWGVFI